MVNPTVSSVIFSVASNISTYTCAPITLNLRSNKQTEFIAKSNVSLTLSGLGQGAAYANLSDCKSGANSTTTVFVSEGLSQVTFYYRTSAAETLTIQASVESTVLGSQEVTSNLFQILGQTSPSTIQ